MSKSLAVCKGTALATLCFYALAGACRAYANVLVNGWFTQATNNRIAESKRAFEETGAGWSDSGPLFRDSRALVTLGAMAF